MIITCDACSTSFNLDDKIIKPTGSKVRCSVCANVFTVFPQQETVPETVATPAEAHTPQGGTATEETDAVEPATPKGGGIAEEAGPISNEDLDESGATVIADLDDEDFNLDLASDDAGEDDNQTIIADLDEDDLDLSLDPPSDAAATVIADLDQDDFNLEISSESDEGLSGNETVIANIDDDLDLDFSLDIAEDDLVPAAEDDSGADSASEDDSDLTLIVDDELGIEPESDDERLELDDDLDLSSLEEFLKDEDDSGDDSSATAADESGDIGLDVEKEDVPAPETDDSDALLENSMEELELDLEAGGEESDSAIGDVDGDDAEIDLSEIEKMLEEPEAASSEFSSAPEQDLDLDIEASLESERWMTDADESDQVINDEELDLSELEQVLDDVEPDASDDVSDDQELELDLSDDGVQAPASEGPSTDEDLAFDLSDFEDEPSFKTEAAPADQESSIDMELEFEVEADSPPEPQQETEEPAAELSIPEPPKTEKQEPVAPASDSTVRPTAMVSPKPAGKGMSKALIFFLIIVILGGGGYGTYYLLNHYNVDIPFLSDYLKPKVNDPGNLKMSTTDINSRFVDNANAGKLFVITGKVKNGYADNRGMVTLVGKIFSAGKILVHEEKVYCGNVMTDLELANLEWDAIKKRLSNRLGDNRSNVKIEPGNSIPFMVVFSGLPDDLEEFTIEVIESTTLK